MNLTRIACVLAVGLLSASFSSVSAQDSELSVTTPELTSEEIAAAFSEGMDSQRWTQQQFNGKVVQWSGVVVEPASGHRTWFERTFGQQLIQIELPELRCDLPVPDRTTYDTGSKLTFIGELAGYQQFANESPIIIFSRATIDRVAE